MTSGRILASNSIHWRSEQFIARYWRHSSFRPKSGQKLIIVTYSWICSTITNIRKLQPSVLRLRTWKLHLFLGLCFPHTYVYKYNVSFVSTVNHPTSERSNFWLSMEGMIFNMFNSFAFYKCKYVEYVYEIKYW